ncbi:alpha-amylase family glycosyl hydrolase [Teredinibacter haidensis]|uniref:alpha-amylase family glycosyl hydrolase n=1 Tax=Teredinibacter haidensis TaxID=2731755 RepID=UPI000948D960|nr:alpha-amylase family glycosyl hydrolase [Teredinibacter haidensis]
MNGLTDTEIFNDRAPGFYFCDGAWFAIFHAPTLASNVQLVGDFTHWEASPLQLQKTESGKFWGARVKPQEFSQLPKAGDKYKFRLKYRGENSWHLTQDPAARNIEDTTLTCSSIVTENNYWWHDQSWQRPGWEYYAIYQVHPARFSHRSTSNPIPRLTNEVSTYIRELGFTALELLPVNAFSQDDSWGYNGVFLYAIETSYGTPNDLKALVDSCHQNGMAVILDVVLNHSGNRDNILWNIDHEEYFSGDTDWGPMFNYGSDVTRHFLINNLCFLTEEYHIDGFRFDMSHIMHMGDRWVNHVRQPGRESGWNFLLELRHKLKSIDPKLLLIAEELPDNWYVTQEVIGSSWSGEHHAPFDSQWCDAYHDNAKAVIRGDHLDKLKAALTYYGDSWHDSINYTESHDEVGNEDARIAHVARNGRGWNISQVSACLTLLSRGIPMIFMGQEAGEWMQFGQNGVASDGSRWWEHYLDLDRYEHDPQQSKILAWYKTIAKIRKRDMWTWSADSIEINHLHNDNGVVAFTRSNGKYLVVLNFNDQVFYDYDLHVEGYYKELANTSWPVFNLFGDKEATRGGDKHHYIHNVHVPAHGAIVLERY